MVSHLDIGWICLLLLVDQLHNGILFNHWKKKEKRKKEIRNRSIASLSFSIVQYPVTSVLS